MNNQNTYQNSGVDLQNIKTLYFNQNYPSGFELFELKRKIYRPINFEDGLIYSRISQQGQDYQIKHIKLYNLIISKVQLDKNQKEGKGEEIKFNDDKEFEELLNQNETTSSLLKSIDYYPSETEIILRQQINQQIFEFEKVIDNSVTFCLIYENQELSEIDQKIVQYKQIFGEYRETNIVIIINGKEKHKFNDQVKFQEDIKENKCNICYTYEYKDCIFLVIDEEQSMIKLLNWIYRGIFKHFQSQYFYVGFLSIQVDVNRFQLMDQMMINENYCGATGYYNLFHDKGDFSLINLNNSFIGYMNFLNYQFQIDSLASLKRFHNPFFSYYKWNDCYKYFDSYFEDLEREYQQGNINLHLNSLFPQKIYESNKKEFFSLSSNLGEKKIFENDQVQIFLELSNKIKSIHICNDQALQLHGNRYKFILTLRNLQTKITLSEVLFLYTFSPYQLLYNVTSNAYLKVLLTIFWPLTLFLLILMFVLLVLQYSIGVSMVKKKKKLMYLILNNDELQIKFGQKLETIKNISSYEYSSELKTKEKVYRFENLIKELNEHQKKVNKKKENPSTFCNSSQQFNNENNQQQDFLLQQNAQSEQIFKISTQLISEKKIDKYYKNLFCFTQIVQLYCSAIVIINLIITYGSNIISEDPNVQQYVTIFGIFVFIGVFLLRNLSFTKQQFLRSIVMTFYIFLNMLITIVYSEMYHLLRIKIQPKEYRKQIKKLSHYLSLNIFLLIILYILETAMNFEGYILSVIIFYNLIIYLLDSFVVIVAKLKEFFNKPINNRSNGTQQSQRKLKKEKFFEKYLDIIYNYLIDLKEEDIKKQEQAQQEKQNEQNKLKEILQKEENQSLNEIKLNFIEPEDMNFKDNINRSIQQSNYFE
ncbi:unnamed protein product [Paramecium primaurelia]|uniref:Transmembrane protein n=1 Tax=Paramecium primaurelia TaxID=5886 RepID=A0A8S1M8T9_PARPR|nr:unnamed protein product [Paramecium primaurelia]